MPEFDYIAGYPILFNSSDPLCQDFDFVGNPNGYELRFTLYNGAKARVLVPATTPIPWGTWITPPAPTC